MRKSRDLRLDRNASERDLRRVGGKETRPGGGGLFSHRVLIWLSEKTGVRPKSEPAVAGRVAARKILPAPAGELGKFPGRQKTYVSRHMKFDTRREAESPPHLARERWFGRRRAQGFDRCTLVPVERAPNLFERTAQLPAAP